MYRIPKFKYKITFIYISYNVTFQSKPFKKRENTTNQSNPSRIIRQESNRQFIMTEHQAHVSP